MSPDTKLGFGQHAKLSMRQVPDGYLDWIIGNMDRVDVVLCARQVKKERESGTGRAEKDLEEQADEWLRCHGVNPRKYSTPVKWQPRRR